MKQLDAKQVQRALNYPALIPAIKSAFCSDSETILTNGSQR